MQFGHDKQNGKLLRTILVQVRQNEKIVVTLPPYEEQLPYINHNERKSF